MSPPFSPVVEKTLAIIFGRDAHQHQLSIEHRMEESGFTLLHVDQISLEELEEAGIELEVAEADESDSLATAVVAQRKGAIKVLRELKGEGSGALNKNSLSALYPDLQFWVSPSSAAATMSISTLFPHLGVASTDNTPSKSAPMPTLTSNSDSKVPFALSNLAHPSPPIMNERDKPLSPSVARALQKLELKEGGGSSSSSATEVEPEDEGEERRVFSYSSRDNTGEIGKDNGNEQEYATSTVSTTDTYSEDFDEEEELEEESNAADLTPTRPKIAPRQSSVASLSAPVVEPRMTKAAALRLGITLPPRAPRNDSESSSPTKVEPERVIATPKSLSAPTIVPRSTKASALRAGDAGTASAKPAIKREAMSTAERNALANASMGHGRRESLPVASVARPKVEVRMTKAAALRTGVELPSMSANNHKMERQSSTASLVSNANSTFSTTSVSISEEDDATSTTSNSRRQSLSSSTIKSIAPPKIVPRGTRSSALRTGVESPAMVRGRSASVLEGVSEEPSAGGEAMSRAYTTGYEGVPGHKRRESIQVASVMNRPKIEPRMTKASALRSGAESPAVVREKRVSGVPVDFVGVPGHRRRESITVASTRPPTIAPRLNRSTLLRQGSDTLLSPTQSRPSSSLGLTRPPSAARSTSNISNKGSTFATNSNPIKIVPRSNKSAELRLKKKASEEEQNASSRASSSASGRPRIVGKVASGLSGGMNGGNGGKALAELNNNGENSPRNSVHA